MPPELGKLVNLRLLELANPHAAYDTAVYCNLRGGLPATFGNLAKLEYLNLSDMPNLGGPIPPELGKLTQLTFLCLDGNGHTGGLPASLAALPQLQTLLIYRNKLTSLPPRTAFANPAGLVLTLQDNRLEFGALEGVFAGPADFGFPPPPDEPEKLVYQPQTLPTDTLRLTLAAGQALTLPSAIGGAHTRYQWQRLVAGAWTNLARAAAATYQLAAVSPAAAGRYRCQATNDWVTGLTLTTRVYVVDVRDMVDVWETGPRNLPDDTNQGVPPLVAPPPAPDAQASAPAAMNYVRTWIPRVALTSSAAGPASTPAPGTVLREQWDNVPGTAVSDIPLGTPPTSTSYLPALEGPANVGDNYGDRLRGYLTAPLTGNNTFWIAGDDNAELWLSTDEAPARKRRIAFVPGSTNPHQLNKYAEQQSAEIQLVAGQRYYLEILHKEGGGGDHLDVAWRWPDGSFHDPAPGSALSPYLVATAPVAADAPPIWTAVQASQSTQYLDGLGRPVQTVLHQASPQRRDLVQPQAYDALGREPRAYLPYPDSVNGRGGYRYRALHDQQQFYLSTGVASPGGQGPPAPDAAARGVARTGVAYAETLFEDSPLNRVVAQAAPGEAWQLTGGHAQRRAERPNALPADSILRFTPGYDPRTADPGYQGLYAAGELWGTQTTDEHGFATIEWKDKLGQVVQKQVETARLDTAGPQPRRWLRTAYAYDDFGHLRAVLQPEATKRVLALSNQPAALPTGAAPFLFHYRYDGRGRQIAKQVPSQAGETLVVYDQLDRPVLSQDAQQRTRREWSWSKYDALGRAVLSGLVTRADTAGQRTLQALAAADTATAHQYEQRTANAGTYPRFYTTDQAFPKLGQQGFGAGQVLSVTRYDDYNFNNDAQGTADVAYDANYDWHFAQTGGTPPVADALRTQGLVTQTQTRVLGVAENDGNYAPWLTTTTFYDERARPVQVQSLNARNRRDLLTTQLDFTGKVVQSVAVHRGPDFVPLVVQEIFTYDHTGRLLTSSHLLPGEAHPTRLSQRTYNELGQLLTDSIGTGRLAQSVDYAYNIRGWLTRLNDPFHPNGADLFNLSLHYEAGFTKGYEQYNGNLTGQTWRGRDGVQRAQGYVYDPLNRLLQGDFVARTAGASPSAGAWTQELDNYRLSFVSYDDNGNIATLRRRGLLQNATSRQAKQYGAVDNLRYAYQGNRLQAVDDAVSGNQLPQPATYHGAPTSLAGDFQEAGVKLSQEYLYDANGNLTQDKNKGLTGIAYNHLNLPRRIQFGTGADSVVFRYAASGQKVAKLVYQTGKPLVRTDYLGPYQYEQDSLKFFPHAEGRVLRFVSKDPAGQVTVSYQREFTIKDHLGNLRLAYRAGQRRTLLATLEQDATTHRRESQQFDSLSVSAPVAQATTLARSGGYAARLNAGGSAPQPLGPLTQLGVQKGDTVTVTAFGLYPQAQQHGFLFSLGSFLASILHPAQGPPPGPEAGKRKNLPLLQVGVAAGLASIPQLSGGVPPAYLRVLVFNRDSTLAPDQPAPVQLTQAAQGSYEQLRVQVLVPQDGYVSAYVGSQSDVDVFFDDVRVEHRPGLLVQETQYDPAGLELAGLAAPSPGIRGLNNYRFNGKEFQADLGLAWNHQDWRFFDPQLLRWHAGDPEVENGQESWTPYSFGYDNAVRYADADGREPNSDPPVKGLGNDFVARAFYGFGISVFNLAGQFLADKTGTPYKYQERFVENDAGEAIDVEVYKEPRGGVLSELKATALDGLNVALSTAGGGGSGKLFEQVAGKTGVAAATTAVKAYDVGTYNELRAASAPHDGLELHHALQQQPAKSLIPGYSGGKGPAIALPKGEHRAIPTLKGANNAGNARSQLAKDIRDIRNNTSAPNSSLQKLIELNKKAYPLELLK